jgi:7,8-dihydropterin-6-yl-methyl-4-(beta-D-ribofuranosyl)aminobenzene 5'-phosphate synthase
MCVDESARHNPHRLLHDVGPVEVVDLEPADMVTVTTVMDSSLDLVMPDQGPPTGWVRIGCGRVR